MSIFESIEGQTGFGMLYRERKAVVNNSVVKIKFIDVIIVLLYFSLVKVYAIPQVVQQGIKIASILVVFVYLFSKIRRKFVNEAFIMVILFLIPSFSGVFNGELTLRVLLDGLLNSICIYMTYMCVQYSEDMECMDRLLNDLYFLTWGSCIISAISVFGQGMAIEANGTKMEYFFGNKFSTCYLFILLVGLAYIRFYNMQKQDVGNKVVYISYILLSISISYWTKCSTTLVGSMFLLVTLFISGKRFKMLQNIMSVPIVACLYVVVPGFIAINMASILQISKLQSFITGVLGKNIGLTGRIYIYSTLGKIISAKPLFGYGYNSRIVESVTKVGNAQNGILQLLAEYGIAGCLAVLIMVYIAFKAARGNRELWGLKVFILVMCICSVVEISFNYLFFLGIFLLRFAPDRQDKYLI